MESISCFDYVRVFARPSGHSSYGWYLIVIRCDRIQASPCILFLQIDDFNKYLLIVPYRLELGDGSSIQPSSKNLHRVPTAHLPIEILVCIRFTLSIASEEMQNSLETPSARLASSGS